MTVLPGLFVQDQPDEQTREILAVLWAHALIEPDPAFEPNPLVARTQSMSGRARSPSRPLSGPGETGGARALRAPPSALLPALLLALCACTSDGASRADDATGDAAADSSGEPTDAPAETTDAGDAPADRPLETSDAPDAGDAPTDDTDAADIVDAPTDAPPDASDAADELGDADTGSVEVDGDADADTAIGDADADADAADSDLADADNPGPSLLEHLDEIEDRDEEGRPILLRSPALMPAGLELALVYDETLDDPITRWAACLALVRDCLPPASAAPDTCVEALPSVPMTREGRRAAPRRA